MKKLIAVMLILVCVGTALSALDKSAGGGLSFGVSFYPSVKEGFNASDYSGILDDATVSVWTGAVLGSLLGPQTSLGAYGFYDLTYLEATIGFNYVGFFLPAVEVGLYGKYPIDMGGFTLFPMAGIEADLLFALLPGFEIWLRGGVGADIDLTSTMFLRPELLYGVGFVNGNLVALSSDNSKLGIAHGLKIRAAIGWRL